MMSIESLTTFMSSRLGKLCTLGLVILFCFLIIWQLIGLFSYFSEARNASYSSESVKLEPPPKVDYKSIIESSLFGQDLSDNINVGNIKRTLLNIKLVGVMLATPEKYSQAIIQLANGKQKVVYEGSVIPSVGKIKKIYAESVIIERDGQIERLTMGKHRLNFEPVPNKLIMEKE
jgi:general secretion pathway protein C